MDPSSFQKLPVVEVARLVREGGPKVCVFPINGTRRWFMLEHSPGREEDVSVDYLDSSARRHIALYGLLFDHGLDTLLAPVFGPDLFERGEEYVSLAVAGLDRLTTHPEFLDFYDTYGVRVRFYGDHVRWFSSTPYAYLSKRFAEVTARTIGHSRHRLFFGVCADDATESVAELAIRYYAERGRVPDKHKLVELYYGEYVGPVNMFIGFDKLCVFDMPLVATGNEDLYFTVCPSPYITERQLRDILYDHVYSRAGGEPDYSAMKVEDWSVMRAFYEANLERTLGLGTKQERSGAWYPLPQVTLPAANREMLKEP